MTPLTLDPITVGGAASMTLQPRTGPYSVGRSSQCDVVVPDESGVVSRRHCEIRASGGAWEVRDAGSRHGTQLNGIALDKDEWARLSHGCSLRVGSSTYRVRMGDTGGATMVRTLDDRSAGSLNIRKMTAVITPDASKRLEMLMKAAATIGSADSSEGIAAVVAGALLEGTPYSRVSVLRRANALSSEFEVLSARVREGQRTPAGFSRSLIEAADDGQTVVLSGEEARNYGESIVSMGVGSAMCAPIMIDGVVDAYLYADSQADLGERVTPEIASLCQTLATMCGMAFADRYRRALAIERKRRDDELNAARQIQAIIMPPQSGGIGGLSYAMRCVPGRFVAGDMFDFVRIDEHRAAVYLGDVVGKGLAAGMMMANVQGHLSRLLQAGVDVGVAITDVSGVVSRYSDRYVSEQEGSAVFLSLFAAVFDVRTRGIVFTDAGHGLWVVRRADGTVHQPAITGGVPVGLLPGMVYESERLTLGAGERFVIFSDGLKEQRSAEGEEFGLERTAAALVGSESAGADCASILDSLCRFVGVPVLVPGASHFEDDVTIASIAIG